MAYSPDQNPPLVFNRELLKKHRNRAAQNFDQFSFLKQRAAQSMVDRLEDISTSFNRVLDLGCHSGTLEKEIAKSQTIKNRVKDTFHCDISYKFTAQIVGMAIAVDEERLPFKSSSFDAVFSCLSLHWVNDLPGTLIQIKNILKPNGLFIGQLLGGRTLHELRTCFIRAETEIRGGASMRVSPFADVQDLSNLLQRAGFSNPVADTETINVRYSHPLKLLQDLRGMGETSALFINKENRPPNLTRTILFRALEIYGEQYATEDGKYPATFEIITASGWTTSPNRFLNKE
ncbi:methyltransferase domain-containing protein [Hirschia maritima]|uniref:methyltransferase domain-containing protein n=1 Tax=Hirschia maritima TaxID=1121961 RepID=UPI00035D18F6|nr:methyltransferase domain-containing protein [Hirschia maritima]